MAAKLLNILLVEDSPNDAGLIVRNIERAGYDVHWERVDDPVALKAALDEQAWDIILSDYCMPAFTGTYALAIIKAGGSGVPVIFVSGTMGEDVAVEAMRAGAQDYVFKGNLKRLVPTIERELRDAAARRESQQAAQALRHNEITYQTLVDNLPQRIFLKDRNSVYISCNRNFARDLGTEPEAVIGKTDFDFHTPEDAQRYHHEDQDVMQSGHAREFEACRVWDGVEHWSHRVRAPFKNESGQCTGILGLYWDITERKQAEKRIAQLDRLKAVLSRVNSAIIHIPDQQNLLNEICRIAVEEGLFKLAWFGEVTPDGSVQVVAKAGLTGYIEGIPLSTHDEPAGRGPTGTAIRENRIVVIEDTLRDPLMAPWHDRAREFGLRYMAAFPLPVAGAVWGSFQVYAPHANFFDENEISLMTQVCEEISLALTAIHHRANREKAEAHLRLQSGALEAAANAIVITDSKGVIQWANSAFAALTGYSFAEVVGDTHRVLKSGKHDPVFYENLWKTVSAGNVWHGEIVNRRKDGVLYTEEMTITPIRDDHGAINHFIAVKQDITARKLLESQLLRSQRMESIGTLAGGIAHDLNNGLAPILMAVEALKRQVTEPGGQRLLSLVATSVEHCSALIRQVLTFARGVEGEAVVIDPLHILREIENIVRDTFPKNIDFISNWSRGIWTVTGDPTQLRQVLVNLCVNARDAMPHGGMLKLTTENVVLDAVYANMNPDSRPGPYVVVKAEDTGGGISPGIRDRIFEPFFTTKDIGKGTGLGLSTTLGIVKSHGGFVKLDSEMGKGTTFHIYLPANPPSEKPGAVAVPAPRLPRGNGELVLLVDDEERLRAMAQTTLEQFGYRVITAANGAEAVAAYAQLGERIDIVLTDMAMPVMDGPAAINAIRSLNPAVKIIASSGLPPAAGNAADLGVKYFVPKPYTAATMLNALAEALREEG